MTWHQHGQKGARSPGPGQAYTLPKGSEQVQVYHRGNPRASVRLRSECYGAGAGKKAQEAQLVPHAGCEPPTGVSLRAPQTTLCAPSVAGGGDGRKRPHTHLVRTPNLTRQGRPSRGARSSWSEHGLAEVKEAKLWPHLASFLLCLTSPSYKTH